MSKYHRIGKTKISVYFIAAEQNKTKQKNHTMLPHLESGLGSQKQHK
jgi:hypothetical protein